LRAAGSTNHLRDGKRSEIEDYRKTAKRFTIDLSKLAKKYQNRNGHHPINVH